MTELPYFKFFPSEWLTGQVSFEEQTTKGAFVDLLCYYWTKGCNITEDQMRKIVKRQHKTIIQSGIVKINDGKVEIDFLDKQLQERREQQEVRRRNGKKGGRPKKYIDPYLQHPKL